MQKQGKPIGLLLLIMKLFSVFMGARFACTWPDESELRSVLWKGCGMEMVRAESDAGFLLFAGERVFMVAP